MNLITFRKSSVTYLMGQNVNRAHLEDHNGWVHMADVPYHCSPQVILTECSQKLVSYWQSQ